MDDSERIDAHIAAITDWRGKTFAQVRAAVRAADPAVTEAWKWMGSPTWYGDGLIAVANAHKGKVKITFANGAKIADPDGLFNAGLEGNARRAIDFLEGDKVDAAALKRLVRAAIDYNRGRLRKRAGAADVKKASTRTPAKKAAAKKSGRSRPHGTTTQRARSPRDR